MTYARLCEHGEVKAHGPVVNRIGPNFGKPACPGGSVLPDDTLVIVKEEDDWPGWVRIVDLPFTIDGILDALASAQGSQE
jgi:hypothetical protein